MNASTLYVPVSWTCFKKPLSMSKFMCWLLLISTCMKECVYVMC